MARIAIDFTGLDANARELRSLIHTLEEQQSSVEKAINEIAPTWTGDASEAFLNRLRDQKEQSQSLINVLYEYLSYVEQAKAKFRDLETTISTIINAILY